MQGFQWYSFAMDEKRKPGRPRTGVTPKRNIRVGQVWDDAAALAAARGETMTAVVERALKHYVTRYRVSRTADGDQAEGAANG
jgi:hypothetical protein